MTWCTRYCNGWTILYRTNLHRVGTITLMCLGYGTKKEKMGLLSESQIVSIAVEINASWIQVPLMRNSCMNSTKKVLLSGQEKKSLLKSGIRRWKDSCRNKEASELRR